MRHTTEKQQNEQLWTLLGGSVVYCVCRTCDREIAGSTPGWCTAG